MTDGQTRVTVLIVVLLVLELLVHPGVSSWVQTTWASINTSLSGAMSGSSNNQNSPLVQALGGVNPNAPSGVIVNGKNLTNAQWRAVAGQNGV